MFPCKVRSSQTSPKFGRSLYEIVAKFEVGAKLCSSSYKVAAILFGRSFSTYVAMQ